MRYDFFLRTCIENLNSQKKFRKQPLNEVFNSSGYNEEYFFCRMEFYLPVDNNAYLQSITKQNFLLHTVTSFSFKLLFVLHSCTRLRLLRQFFPLNIICLFLISRYLVHVTYRVLWLVWLTFHGRVVLQNLIVDELARNSLTFYRNRVFVTVFIRPQHLSLSRAMYSYETTFSSISSLASKQRVGFRCDIYPAR